MVFKNHYYNCFIIDTMQGALSATDVDRVLLFTAGAAIILILYNFQLLDIVCQRHK